MIKLSDSFPFETIVPQMKSDMLLINILIGLIIYGIALKIRKEDLIIIFKQPKIILTAILCQYLVLPLSAFLTLQFFDVHPHYQLGIITLATIPGGNLSKFYAQLSKGNLIVSFGMSALSSFLCFLVTPITFQLLCSVLELEKYNISFSAFDMFWLTFKLLIIPTLLGILTTHFLKKKSLLISKIMKVITSLVYIFFFFYGIHKIQIQFTSIQFPVTPLILIALMHSLAISIVTFITYLFKIEVSSRKSITLEVTIQNVSIAFLIAWQFLGGFLAILIIPMVYLCYQTIAGYFLVKYFQRIEK
jgi:BASS family bile acid:Na+ symporter